MEEPRITPLARRLAEENGIDWRRLQGTGPDGTIVERDILAFLAKVMAGEVDLPPMPEEPPPQVPEADLRRAQEALGREGVDLADLLPEPPKAPTLEVEEVAEEALDLEPALLEDLELDLEEAPLLAEEPPLPAEAWEEAPPKPAPSPLEEELEALLAEEAALPEAAPEEALEEAFFLEETPADLLEEPLEEVLAELEASPPPVPEAPLAPASGLVASPAPQVAAKALRVYRRTVGMEALGQALAAFHRLHGVPETPLPFLLKAAERALAELEIPLRPLLGRVEGDGVRGLRPASSFLALFRQEEGEEGEGLLCFFGEEELHTGRPSLFLSPEGILAASGLEAPLAQKLLERVALYLENLVLLLA
ncbi:E3 binding domain-containing protein [Thermus igniterrae]|jgi:hypothetical protein|uniref:E3 binding domain-containing protein n=1 Tax=Thermus igniterrae TaxID=88189 RepID=UPI00037A9D38|nr:E3 binding domain-containing protein [Thermus igniterrae]